jgi:hypothetical protein
MKLRYWHHFAGQDNVVVNRNGMIEIDAVVELADRRRIHSTKVYHYAGRPSRASSLRKLPLKSASAVLILSDDDNEVALASDSQCLTNLILTAQICNGSEIGTEDDNIDILDEEDDSGLTDLTLSRHHSITNMLGNALPSIKVRVATTPENTASSSKDDEEKEVPPPIPPGLEVSKSTLAKKPPTMHVVCEILSPSTPKMVRVVKNPFTTEESSASSSPSSISSTSSSSSASSMSKINDDGIIDSPIQNTRAQVNYFCTYKLETAMLATHCYNKIVTEVFEYMVKSIQTRNTDNPFAIEAIQCCTILKSDKWPMNLSFRDLETLMYLSCKRVLLGWMRDGTHESRTNTNSIDGLCLNPVQKDLKIDFCEEDLLIFM